MAEDSKLRDALGDIEARYLRLLDDYRKVIVANVEVAKINLEQAETIERVRHEFKNFHRLLCERFGYGHDDVDWQRDQLSLIEWIAKRLPAETDSPRICHWRDCRIVMAPGDSYLCLEHRMLMTRPADCSGDPKSCPDNEGTGCYCSRSGLA